MEVQPLFLERFCTGMARCLLWYVLSPNGQRPLACLHHFRWAFGVDPVVIPNGLGPESFEEPDAAAVAALRSR